MPGVCGTVKQNKVLRTQPQKRTPQTNATESVPITRHLINEKSHFTTILFSFFEKNGVLFPLNRIIVYRDYTNANNINRNVVHREFGSGQKVFQRNNSWLWRGSIVAGLES